MVRTAGFPVARSATDFRPLAMMTLGMISAFGSNGFLVRKACYHVPN